MLEIKFTGRDLVELRYKILDFVRDITAPPVMDSLDRASEQFTEAKVDKIPEIDDMDIANPLPREPELKSRTTTETITAGSTYDSAGTPWDARIHQTSKALNKDGTWRERRGLDEKVKETVKNELKNKVPVVATPLAPPIIGPADVSPFTHPTPATLVTPPIEPQKDYAAIPLPNSPNAYTLDNFKNSIAAVIASLIDQGKIDQKYVEALCAYFEVEHLWEMFEDTEKVEKMYNNFCDTGLLTRINHV